MRISAVAGAEDAEPRTQPLYNTVRFLIAKTAWDRPENRWFTYANFEKMRSWTWQTSSMNS